MVINLHTTFVSHQLYMAKLKMAEGHLIVVTYILFKDMYPRVVKTSSTSMLHFPKSFPPYMCHHSLKPSS